RALRISLERYQAAVADGDTAAARLQAGAMATYGNGTADGISDTADGMRDLADRMAAASGDFAVTSELYADASSFRDRVQASGFSAAEIADMHSAGATDADIAAV